VKGFGRLAAAEEADETGKGFGRLASFFPVQFGCLLFIAIKYAFLAGFKSILIAP
jgi:hypothetical protein